MGLLLARKNKEREFHKVLNTTNNIYSISGDYRDNAIEFRPDIALDDNSWFFINCFSDKPYCWPILIQAISTAELNELKEVKNTDIEILLEYRNDMFFIQKITHSKVITTKKFFGAFKDGCEIKEVRDSIEISRLPTAIYDQRADKLYFKKFNSLTGIFDGIIELYREATDDEVNTFLQSSFIKLNNFGVNDVKIENRKRIAAVQQDICNWKINEWQAVLDYIHSYAVELNYENNTFTINNEKELKLLLRGLEQRFYTTIVGEKKYIANSVVSM